ncbi:acyl-CoA thioesterase [Desulfopila inferna]|uniref:acyl-CoA thioesterase n=1 Tax=Desulfopila inferna TaxID=468528 RepID=UPI0019643EBB|nr:thioesterase family protein [Desulfopila inferna]MBM9603453.1 acyl-CoA thioesterase [Desulfopila inferna]
MKEPVHRSRCRVLYGDTDAAGVVYNANYLRYFEIGRTEMMRDWVCSYRDIEKLGILLPVTECFSRFKAPAFYDDLLTIETAIDTLKKVSCRFHYRITRDDPELGQPKLLVKGYTIHAAVNREGRLVQLPEEISAKLHGLIKMNLPQQ